MHKSILIPLEEFSETLYLFYRNDSVLQNIFLFNMTLRKYPFCFMVILEHLCSTFRFLKILEFCKIISNFLISWQDVDSNRLKCNAMLS